MSGGGCGQLTTLDSRNSDHEKDTVQDISSFIVSGMFSVDREHVGGSGGREVTGCLPNDLDGDGALVDCAR